MNLAALKPGQTAVIGQLDHEHPSALRLAEMGFIQGRQVTVIRKAPFGDPLQIRLDRTVICLRKADAAMVGLDPSAQDHHGGAAR